MQEQEQVNPVVLVAEVVVHMAQRELVVQEILVRTLQSKVMQEETVLIQANGEAQAAAELVELAHPKGEFQALTVLEQLNLEMVE